MKAATNVFHAARYASAKGNAFNHAVTINWDRLGIANDVAMTTFQKLRRRVRARWKYLRKAGQPVGYLDDAGAHENPQGCRNTHWLVHVPPSYVREFEATVRKLLIKLTGATNTDRALHFAQVPAPGSFVKYILKGVDKTYASYFRMNAVDQGFIIGHGRTFVARNVSMAARKRAGWSRKPSSTQQPVRTR